jgi:hypothetical protein
MVMSIPIPWKEMYVLTELLKNCCASRNYLFCYSIKLTVGQSVSQSVNQSGSVTVVAALGTNV